MPQPFPARAVMHRALLGRAVVVVWPPRAPRARAAGRPALAAAPAVVVVGPSPALRVPAGLVARAVRVEVLAPVRPRVAPAETASPRRSVSVLAQAVVR